MLWLVEDFGLLSVILRALVLTLQTLTVGGIFFALLVLRSAAPQSIADRTHRWVHRFAIALAIVGVLYVATDSTILMTTVDVPLSGLTGADYFVSGALAVVLAALIALLARRSSAVLGLLGTALVVNAVFTSHAVSRMDHRAVLGILTFLHQGGAAIWMGGVAFLMLALRDKALSFDFARSMLSRFGVLAIAAAATLAVSGTILAVFYIGSVQALYGTSYGVMVAFKALLFLLLVLVGALNFSYARSGTFARSTIDLLRRISELELAIFFAVLLTAASLTSQPPGVDLVDNRLTVPEIASHFAPHAPQLSHPPLESLAPATPLEEKMRSADNLERAADHTNRDPDLAWSEFEHNWAGIFLIGIGILATLAATPYARWARFWPLAFIVMAIFLMIFSDPENWPLGPIGYWESFSDPEVLLHRVALCFLIVFGVFEAGVQTGRLSTRYAMVFPFLSMLGAGGFLLHSHTLGNVRLEMLTELSHTPISVFGILMGAFRCMEIWLRDDQAQFAPSDRPGLLTRPIQIASFAWPICMAAAGVILLNYREG